MKFDIVRLFINEDPYTHEREDFKGRYERGEVPYSVYLDACRRHRYYTISRIVSERGSMTQPELRRVSEPFIRFQTGCNYLNSVCKRDILKLVEKGVFRIYSDGRRKVIDLLRPFDPDTDFEYEDTNRSTTNAGARRSMRRRRNQKSIETEKGIDIIDRERRIREMTIHWDYS